MVTWITDGEKQVGSEVVSKVKPTVFADKFDVGIERKSDLGGQPGFWPEWWEECSWYYLRLKRTGTQLLTC